MRYLILLIVLILFSGLQAQQEAMFTRYMFHSMYLFDNPAYAGTHGHWTANALYRTQWTGFDGAPQTVSLGGEGMINRAQNAGLGFSLNYDRIGLDRVGEFAANYAYHLRLDDVHCLALGIRASVLFYGSSLSRAVVWDAADPVYTGGDISGIIPKAGLGVFWYGEDYFAGLSVPTLVAFDQRTDFSIDLDKSGILRRHYYLYGGYVFHLDHDIDLKPSLLLKYQPQAPLQVDFNLNAWVGDIFSVGASYRTGDAVSVMLEIPITDRLRIGYAFDNTISALRNVSSGTHEVMLGYDFGATGDHGWDRITPINRF